MSELNAFLTQYGFDAADLNAPREHGLTPLMRAALLGRLDLVEALLARGVDLHRRNADGNTALWLACVSGQVPLVKRLAAAGIDLDNRNDTGASALMYAASSGKDVMVALLLQLGADPYLQNQDGARAVDMAASRGALQLLRHTATAQPTDLFGGAVSAAVAQRIEAAKAGPREQLAAQLWAIQADAPECLPVYYLLYKHHAGRRELQEAERAALLGLSRAGLAAGLPRDPEAALGAPQLRANFQPNGPARFWLFTLKALAFIRMRSERLDEARALLGLIGRLDPDHSTGSDVTEALLHGAVTAPAAG